MAEIKFLIPDPSLPSCWGGVDGLVLQTKRDCGRVKFSQRRIRDRLEIAASIWVVSVIRKQWTHRHWRSMPESTPKYGVLIVQPMKLNLVWYVCKQLFNIISWWLRTFHVKNPDPTNGVPRQNPSLPLLFTSLLLTYNAMGSGLVTLQPIQHYNSFR